MNLKIKDEKASLWTLRSTKILVALLIYTAFTPIIVPSGVFLGGDYLNWEQRYSNEEELWSALLFPMHVLALFCCIKIHRYSKGFGVIAGTFALIGVIYGLLDLPPHLAPSSKMDDENLTPFRFWLDGAWIALCPVLFFGATYVVKILITRLAKAPMLTKTRVS